jgi:hypothetical protein
VMAATYSLAQVDGPEVLIFIVLGNEFGTNFDLLYVKQRRHAFMWLSIMLWCASVQFVVHCLNWMW